MLPLLRANEPKPHRKPGWALIIEKFRLHIPRRSCQPDSLHPAEKICLPKILLAGFELASNGHLPHRLQYISLFILGNIQARAPFPALRASFACKSLVAERFTGFPLS